MVEKIEIYKHIYQDSDMSVSTIKELNFDYIKPYLNLYKRIGDKIKKHNRQTSIVFLYFK